MVLGACTGRKEASNTDNTQTEVKQDTMLQREIMGIVLGTTQKDSALYLMEQRGYPMKHLNRGVFVCRDMQFGNEVWDYMSLVICDDKVRKIMFVKPVNDEEEFYDVYNELSLVLKNKYNPLIALEDTATQKSYIYFEDSVTSLKFGINAIGTQPVIQLSYSDKKLEHKYSENAYNEL